ncbi:hypothetical protein NPIL_454071 [Nephila pilipes]|uniref:Uncharacterized protein n=1 Tax=Nephila pilipes TaxID=299642 RepID=A0A8X6TH34_NEPPI|nr:hypothetical protein NPIL_454071 [Nephila pilipes]
MENGESSASTTNIMEKGDNAIIISPEINDQISIPALQKDIPKLALMKFKREDFIRDQKDHGDLKMIYEKVLSQINTLDKSYSLVNELLAKNREDIFSNIVKLLVAPEGLLIKLNPYDKKEPQRI